jgi:D-glycero-D-manno-heptose 1,7-bisphosphate phosphatase
LRAPGGSSHEHSVHGLRIQTMGAAAVFLDRDGTLNVKPPEGDYVRSPADFQWLPGAATGAAALADAGFALCVVSNQRGVARGLVDEATLRAIELLIQETLRPLGARVEAFRYCRHELRDGCPCRKPAPGMILGLARERGLNLQRSWMIGDAHSDITAGKAAGCMTALLGEPTESRGEAIAPDLVTRSLLDASEQIVSRPETMAAPDISHSTMRPA